MDWRLYLSLTDGRTGYLYNAYLYTGKNSDGLGLSSAEQKLLLPSQCVLRLSKPIQNTNRNITADNYFSSIELCNELKKVGLTYVGTVKKNKREFNYVRVYQGHNNAILCAKEE